MDWETRAEILEVFNKAEQRIMDGKAREYASQVDTLSNFKVISDLINQCVPMIKKCPECGHEVEFEIDPMIVLAIYFMKHVLALMDYTGRKESLSSESLMDRVLDIRVYAMLAYALAKDMDNGKNNTG